jgi:hypothetical protein
VRQSPAGKGVNVEKLGIYIVGSRDVATTSEDKLRTFSVCCSEKWFA